MDPRLGRVTFGQWAADYLTTIVHLRSITRSDCERTLRVHLLPAFDRVPVERIEPIDVRRLMSEKQAAGQSPKSLQKMRLVLRQVLELARASGAIRTNPCDGLRLPRAVQAEPVFLTAEQIAAFACATRPPYDLLVRLVAATGLRPSEVCGLRVGKVNLRRGTLEISEALTVVGGRTEVGPTKTYARCTVGVPASVRDDLAAYLERRARQAAWPLETPPSTSSPHHEAGPYAGTSCSSASSAQPSKPPDSPRDYGSAICGTRAPRCSSTWERIPRRSKSVWGTAPSRSPWTSTVTSSQPSTKP